MATEKQKRDHTKDMILLIGGLFIVAVSIVVVGTLLYSSMSSNNPLPEYALAFFSSITTLILGYLFGRGRN